MGSRLSESSAQNYYRNSIPIAFNGIKSKHFLNAMRVSSVISYTRQLVAQELDNCIRVYMRASFVDLLQESVS